jgi:hypothetical protein
MTKHGLEGVSVVWCFMLILRKPNSVRIWEIGKIDEKAPQQRENKIGPNLRTSPQSKL